MHSMCDLVVNQLSKRVHILSFKFPLSQHWEKQDFIQKYISEIVAREKFLFIFVVISMKEIFILLDLQKYTKELIFSWNNTLVPDVAYLLTRMPFQRKWGLWFWTAFPFCVCAFVCLFPNIIFLDFACQKALCYNHSS